MVCKICGAKIAEDSKFCGSCGSSIENEAVATAVQQEPAADVVDNVMPENQQQSYSNTNADVDTVSDAQLYQAASINLETGVASEAQYQQSMNGQFAGNYQQNMQQNYQQNTQQYYQNNVQQQPKTKQPMDAKKKTVLIVGIVAAVLVVIAAVMFIVLFSIGSKEKNTQKPVETTQTVAVSDEQAKEFFNKFMADNNGASYPFVYCKDVNEIKTNKLNYLCDDIGTFYSWTGFNGTLTNGTLKASDIMTQAEHDKIVVSGVYTWSVFKSTDVQAKLDSIYGKGVYKVSDFANETSMVTASGYLLFNEEPVNAPDVLYYGNVVSCTNKGTEYIIEANVVKCDNASQAVYDEATGTWLSAGTVTPGTSVNFDSVISGLQINKANLGKITFTYTIEGKELKLKSVVKPEPTSAGAVQVPTTQYTPSVSGEVISVSSYGRYVKAGGGLYLRALPSTYASSVLYGTMPNGSYVTVIGKSPYYSDWVYVNYNGYTGWANANYLVTYKPTTSSYNYNGIGYATVSAGGGLNMRSGPSKNSSRVGNIPNGTTVYINYYDSSYSWAYVYYGGVYGWVNTAYLY